MALKFSGKGAGAASSSPAGSSSSGKMNGSSKPPQNQNQGASWLKTGEAAKNTLAQAEAAAEMAKANAGKAWRFWIKEGEDKKITFLDGEVDDDGILSCPMYHEHSILVNGDRTNFVCTQEQEGYCPICAMGNDSKSALVGVLSVLDHTPHKVQNGPNAGKIIQHTRKLFVAKKGTIRLLSKIALKRGGLTGATFEVSRTGDKAPNVGDQFDYVEKASYEHLASTYGLDLKDVGPLNYAEEITYLTSAELLARGIGKAHSGIGKEAGVHESSKLKDQL